MNKRLMTATAIILVFIAFGVIGTRDESSSTPEEGIAGHLQADYDYYINDMLLDHFEPGARHGYTLKADRVTHYPEGEFSLLEEPRMTWYGVEQTPWQLDAQRGVMRPLATGGGDHLVLTGNVLASTLTGDGRNLQFSTQSLDIVPSNKSAHTVQPVRIDTTNMYMLGTGMNVDMNSKRIQLLSEVSARHEPPANP